MLQATIVEVFYNGHSILSDMSPPTCRSSTLLADGTSIVEVPLTGTATVDGREVETQIFTNRNGDGYGSR